MADDVTQGKPLKGGRQRANHIQVHRLEWGMWERKNIIEPLSTHIEALAATKALNNVANSINGLIAAAGMVGVGYLGTKWWAQYKAGHLEEPSLWDLANDPMQMKKVVEEKGFWKASWDVLTTPAIHLDDLF
jgi:hypothetical protein